MIPLALQQAAPEFFDLSSNMDGVGAWMVCFFTLAVYSFLYRDNAFYKTAEHVFVGAGTAFFALQYYEEGIKGAIWEHIERAVNTAPGEIFELGGYAVDPTVAIVLRCIAAVLGLMLLSRLFLPNSWMARWPLAIMVGVYAALKMTGETQSKLVLQVKGAMKPWATTDGGLLGSGEVFYQNLSYVILLVGLICALLHFVFTFQRGKTLGGISRVGVVTLMITFGSMFGFTVLGRYALLIERLDNLAGFTAPAYSLLASADSAGASSRVSQLISPPWIVAGILVLGLLITRASGESDSASAS